MGFSAGLVAVHVHARNGRKTGSAVSLKSVREAMDEDNPYMFKNVLIRLLDSEALRYHALIA